MNAREEFIQHTQCAKSPIKCATIETISFGYKVTRVANLGINHSPEDMDRFLNELNFEYNEGYGSQTLFGTIWYTDGTWSTRGEYDGSEWWVHHKCPAIYFNDPSSMEEHDEVDYWDGDESDRISY